MANKRPRCAVCRKAMSVTHKTGDTCWACAEKKRKRLRSRTSNIVKSGKFKGWEVEITGVKYD